VAKHNLYTGSDFDDFLKEEGVYEEVQAKALKRALSEQLGDSMQAAKLTKAGKLLSVAGGGDTVAALAHAGVEDGFTYVSTAGGAFLEWLEGKVLPGVAGLRK